MRMGARYGGLNPVIALDLCKRVGIPKMLHGCELWHLNRHAACIRTRKYKTLRCVLCKGFYLEYLDLLLVDF